MSEYKKHIERWDTSSVSNIINHADNLVNLFKNKENLVVIDVGANSGTFFDRLLSNLDIKRAILFEPQNDLYQYIKEKYKNNSNIIVEPHALSDNIYEYELDDRSFLFYMSEMNKIETEYFNLGLSRIDYIKNGTHKTQSFDNLRHNYNLDKIDIIKIDTEGEDLRALKGFTQTVIALKEKPLIEFESNWQFSHTKEEAQKILDVFCINTGYENNIDLDSPAGGEFYLYPNK